MTSAYKPLTSRQREKIQSYLRDDRKLNAAVANVLSTRKKSPRARRLAKADPQETARSICNLLGPLPLPVRRKIKDVLCDRHAFCQNRGDFQLMMAVIPALGAAIAPYIATVPLCIWVVLIKNRALEIFCDCDPATRSEFLNKLIEKFLGKGE